jgi:prevent-host-death family protein
MSAIPKIIPISDLRQDAAALIKRAGEDDEPIFITQRGRASAVLVSTRRYERDQRELDILRRLAAGERELEAGAGTDLENVLTEARKLLDRAAE